MTDPFLRWLVPEEEEGFRENGHSKDQGPDLAPGGHRIGHDQEGALGTMLAASRQFSGYGRGGPEKLF